MVLHRFGPFELNEEARELRLRGETQPLQPRVYEFVLYLVRNAGRVVPKDELMDVLWPNVTVTESSLQRAASLARRALAAGGLGEAIRNFARYGYRFAVDEPQLGILTPEGKADGALAAAREASRQLKWETASRQFAKAAEANALDPEDLELWALADECRGRPVDGVAALTKAIEAHQAAGQPERAGRAAVTLAKVELERGAGAVAEGWLTRAESILTGISDLPARAYLLWMKARLASFGGHAEEALGLATLAAELAESSGDAGLRALTLVYKGFFNLSLGNIDEGSRLQNHAAAIALSSQVDPITGSLIYCNILWSCRTFADWERALQWSDGFEAWCATCFAENPGSCDLHRAEILGARGTLAEASAKITNAIPKLSEEESWSLGEGYRVRGDIAAMMGDFAAAEVDYAMAYSLDWDAEPGNAVLLAERGDVDAALAALDRALEGRSWYHLQRRGVLLVNAAKIAATAGQRKRAERYLAEVEAEEARWPQPAIRALIAETQAALLGAIDSKATQLKLLARQLWTSAKLDYHAARVRLELARDCLAAGDIAGAEAELSGAERIAQKIESPRLADECAAMRSAMAAPARRARKDQAMIRTR